MLKTTIWAGCVLFEVKAARAKERAERAREKARGKARGRGTPFHGLCSCYEAARCEDDWRALLRRRRSVLSHPFSWDILTQKYLNKVSGVEIGTFVMMVRLPAKKANEEMKWITSKLWEACSRLYRRRVLQESSAKHSLESSWRDLQDLHAFAPRSIQNFSQISSNFFACSQFYFQHFSDFFQNGV